MDYIYQSIKKTNRLIVVQGDSALVYLNIWYAFLFWSGAKKNMIKLGPKIFCRDAKRVHYPFMNDASCETPYTRMNEMMVYLYVYILMTNIIEVCLT